VRKARVLIALAVILGSLVWVAAKGLSSSLVYYNTPTDLLRKGDAAIGDRARLGGLVLPGSVEQGRGLIRFIVTDGTTHMRVVDRGSVPELFREGQGVVVEGFLGRDGSFHADTVLIKHSGVYRPPAPGETPTAADLEGT
jgi:cytochrome c-type biogenesis protein CcmE